MKYRLLIYLMAGLWCAASQGGPPQGKRSVDAKMETLAGFMQLGKGPGSARLREVCNADPLCAYDARNNMVAVVDQDGAIYTLYVLPAQAKPQALGYRHRWGRVIASRSIEIAVNSPISVRFEGIVFAGVDPAERASKFILKAKGRAEYYQYEVRVQGDGSLWQSLWRLVAEEVQPMRQEKWWPRRWP